MLTSATRGETLTPNPNECNSTLTSGTNNIYPYPYMDINYRGHRLRPHVSTLLLPMIVLSESLILAILIQNEFR